MKRRLTWDEYFLLQACVASLRSACYHRKVGCVIVQDKRVLCSGYNGTPSGFWNCIDVFPDCPKESGSPCLAIHAEENAILQAALKGISIEGSVFYCTHEPCIDCLKRIIQVGAKRVVFLNRYYEEPPDFYVDLASAIEMVHFTPEGDFDSLVRSIRL